MEHQMQAVTGKLNTNGRSPAQEAKSQGLKNLTQVSNMTGVSLNTLINWHRYKPQLFHTVIAGCVAIQNS